MRKFAVTGSARSRAPAQCGGGRSMVDIIGVVMLIAFLAGTLPAASAARQNPIEALRCE